jgi:type I restriction enzyme S subunit
VNSRSYRTRYLVRPIDERLGNREFPLLSVSSYRGVVPRSELTDKVARADELTNYKVCRPGDIVVNRMSAYQGALGISHWTGIVSPDYVVLRPQSGIEPRWLHHLMRSGWFVSEMSLRVRGIGSIGTSNVRTPRVSAEEIGEIVVEVPDLTTQRSIADYLDAETARIDALIEKKQRMVEIAGARVWGAFMSRLHDLDAPMVPIRRGLAFITDGPFGSAFSSSDYSDDGAAVVRLGNIGFAKYRPQDQAFLPMEIYQNFQRCWVLPGDVLIAGLGDDKNHAGRACLAPDLGPALVKGKCFCAHVRGDITDAGFLSLLLSSPLGAELVGLSARGSTRSMINLEVIKDTAIPMPSVPAQQALAERTVEERHRTDGLIEALTSIILPASD